MAMVSESRRRPGGESVDNLMTGGADKFGWQTTQQARGDRRHNNQPSTGVLEAQ